MFYQVLMTKFNKGRSDISENGAGHSRVHGTERIDIIISNIFPKYQVAYHNSFVPWFQHNSQSIPNVRSKTNF